MAGLEKTAAATFTSYLRVLPPSFSHVFHIWTKCQSYLISKWRIYSTYIWNIQYIFHHLLLAMEKKTVFRGSLPFCWTKSRLFVYLGIPANNHYKKKVMKFLKSYYEIQIHCFDNFYILQTFQKNVTEYLQQFQSSVKNKQKQSALWASAQISISISSVRYFSIYCRFLKALSKARPSSFFGGGFWEC